MNNNLYKLWMQTPQKDLLVITIFSFIFPTHRGGLQDPRK